MNFNTNQTGNAMSGGWRFPFDRQTSTSALYQPQGIDPEFLKRVAALEQQAPKGLIDAAVTAQPLQGLLDAPGGAGGQDQANGQPAAQQGGGWSTDPATGNRMQEVSPAGFNVGFDPKAGGLGFMKGGILGGVLGGMTAQRTAPVFNMAPAGLTDYGTSPTANGPTTEAQAKALADELAKSLAQYETGGGLLGGYDVGGYDYGGNSMDYGS